MDERQPSMDWRMWDSEKKTNAFYRFIRFFVWLFAPAYRLRGWKRLEGEPCVIVGNHSQMYGPVAGELFLPGKHYIWCAGQMMTRGEVAAYAYQDFWSKKPKAVRWFFKIVSHLIEPLSLLVFNNAHTIPVYHDTRLLTTFRSSMEKLSEGNSIVIFPECYDEHNNIVHAFQQKFVDLARFYYKKTGTALRFVPMYLAPELGILSLGEAVRFDPAAPIEQERERICQALMDGITAMAVDLPEHRVVPYPNVSRRHYPKNIPLEVYHESKND